MKLAFYSIPSQSAISVGGINRHFSDKKGFKQFLKQLFRYVL